MARKSKGSISIDKGISIFKPKGCRVWHIDINVPGRKRTRPSLDTQHEEEARILAKQRAQEILSESNGVIIPRDVPYEEMLKLYKKHIKHRHTPKTQELSLSILDQICGFIHKHLEIARKLRFTDFTPATIEEYMESRKSEGRTNETINRERGVLLTFFNRAKRRKLIRFNPADDVDPYPVVRKRIPKTLNSNQVQKLIIAAGQDVDLHGRGQKGKGNVRTRLTPMRQMILFVLNTAARLSELLFLEWRDIDFKDGLITIRNKKEHQLKDREDRVIRGNSILLKVLRYHKMSSEGKRWVFCSTTGEPFDRKNVLRELKGAAERAKIENVNFLILRHTALTAAARTRIPPFVLKELAGHASIRTTERYYIGRTGTEDWTPPSLGT